MADSYTKPHLSVSDLNSTIRPIPICQGKSFTNLLCKVSIFALFVVVIPLFPSQAPDFVNQTILTKFWELFHLLFVGIAVSYGLFCRRHTEVDYQIQTSAVDTAPYNVSKMFHMSPFFEDKYENLCISDDKRVNYHRNSQYFGGESAAEYYDVNTLRDKQWNPHFPASPNGLGPIGYGGENAVQAWNSEYFRSQPMVVVAKPNYCVDQFDEVAGYKPLGLPVRSLRTRARSADSPESISECESGSVSEVSSKSSCKSTNVEFGDLGPANLEQKFNEAAKPTSPIPWRSRSINMRKQENHNYTSRPSHFRPLSVDETQFESLGSRSFHSTASSPSHGSSISPLNSVHSESMDLQHEGWEETDHSQSSSPSNSPVVQSRTPGNRKALLDRFHTRHYSFGSLPQKDLEGLNDRLGSNQPGLGPVPENKKLATLANCPSKGKSVRTIRSNRLNSDRTRPGELCGKHVDNKVELEIYHNLDQIVNRRDKLKRGTLHRPKKVEDEQRLHSPYAEAKAPFSENKNRDERRLSKNIAVGLKQDSDSEPEKSKNSSDEDSMRHDDINDEGFDSNEVDKKAGEFIAKFREQIRLQKTASIERSRGLRTSVEYNS